MQIKHLKTIIQPSDGPNRITALAWSPNNQKLAVVGTDKIVQLYDETGERKDRFATKPADPKSERSYLVCAMAFSPDSTKLAVAQTDGVVFIYKLGLEWGEKKSICNKFIQTSDITCLTWPREQPNAIVFGMADGKVVRVGNLKSNKAATLYQTESYVLSAASSPDGNGIATGHIDGSINRFFFNDGASGAAQGKFTVHTTPPTALAWGESIVAAGADKCITFYDANGRIFQNFDYQGDENQQEFSVATFGPNGQTIVVGSFDKFHIFNWSTSKQVWVEAPPKVVENMYTITAFAWKPDGSRLVSGTLCGAVEMFDCCLRRSRYRGKFEFTYVSPSQVIVKRLSTGSRIILKSHYGYEINKINIFQDQFLIANTPETLLLGDLSSCKLSEIPWRSAGNEKYFFQNPAVCMIFNAGELTLIEYGVNEILGSCRTEQMNPHLISLRINERKSNQEIKKIAYLVDLQTIQILDLLTGMTVANIVHDARIDWLELSGTATKLLYRDKRHQLYLFDVASQIRTTLLNVCSYVQWVPNSDVVVAQSRSNLCIWYNIDAPERLTMFAIKGEVEDIERNEGKTEVIVDEGVNTVSYTLDECLIEFGTAMDDRDYQRAINLLETLEMTPETEAMWQTLSQCALGDRNLLIAERCYAALGDVARARYLHNLNDFIEKSKQITSNDDQYRIKAKLAVLDKQFKLAERIYMEQGRIEEAMEMYQEIHKWDLSIKVAEAASHPEVENLRLNYFQWLIESGQIDKAGELKEDEGDYIAAINLYLKGGMAARAANVVRQRRLTDNEDLTERVAGALVRSGLFEKAGEFYEKIGNKRAALDAYKAGNAFRAAVELSRYAFPQEIISLEEKWGDYLVTQRQTEAAISHYIEAGKNVKAMEAALAAKAWKKACSVLDNLEPSEQVKKYCLQLAKHFDECGDYVTAEKYYVQASRPQDAVDMYTRANKLEKAHALATTYMSPEQVSYLYINHAQILESKGKFKEAEKLYLAIDEPDLAINMYKNAKQYDSMIRLVAVYHKDLLVETHLFLAKTLESESNFKLAERHYVEGKEWKSAVNMYCSNGLYEDAHRIAKTHGGIQPAKQVAYLWARSLGGEAAAKLLSKLDLLDYAIDFASENGAFEFAFELAKYGDKSKVNDVYLRQAMAFEDEGKFAEAEKAFVLAQKPKEAILMHIHNEDWEAAQRVATAHDPTAVVDVLIGQAKVAFNAKDFSKAESLILRAQRPDFGIRFYKECSMWKEAIKFAKEYIPAKLSEIQDEYEKYLSETSGGLGGGGGKDEIISTARLFEQQLEYSRAIDMYLKVSFTHTPDTMVLSQLWTRAADLALKHVADRAVDVVKGVGKRLIDIHQYELAAKLFARVELFKDAIDTFIMDSNWEEAKNVVKVAPKYADYFEGLYVEYLKSQGKVDTLANVNAAAALDVYARNREWEKCLQTASAQGPDVLNKYLITYSSMLLKDGKAFEVVKLFAKYSLPASSLPSETVVQLSEQILRSSSKEAYIPLRDMLKKYISNNGNSSPEIRLYLLIAHFLTLKMTCETKQDLIPFATKLTISLLRYTHIIPADNAFYEAGRLSKNAGMENMAFVCFNRFIDLSDAIEDGDTSMLENNEFENTDIPTDVCLPKVPFPEKLREEIRDWILSVSLDKKVNHEIDQRDCGNCGTKIYDAALNCFNCGVNWEPCIVTGFSMLGCFFMRMKDF
ncbi:hypothetical protein BKA69DRAFT_1032603 [Paraphysoderma sedebokerense]|nr:hypothetical protein BKA69DRAFT_1032603 [Paraphysoderma sedebokerense]